MVFISFFGVSFLLVVFSCGLRFFRFLLFLPFRVTAFVFIGLLLRFREFIIIQSTSCYTPAFVAVVNRHVRPFSRGIACVLLLLPAILRLAILSFTAFFAVRSDCFRFLSSTAAAVSGSKFKFRSATYSRHSRNQSTCPFLISCHTHTPDNTPSVMLSCRERGGVWHMLCCYCCTRLRCDDVFDVVGLFLLLLRSRRLCHAV